MMKKTRVRLPAHVKPERYRLMLKPDLKGFKFEGEETVYLSIDKPVTEIILHAKELKILKAGYQALSSKYKVKQIKYDKKAETVTFSFGKTLPKGKGELEIKFKGVLNDKLRGFYRSKYFHKGKEKHLATTQFEATDARQAFPCVDEPAAKAVFDVTLMVPKGLVAISNTLETDIAEHDSGYKIVKFAPTPKMSTYLLAFIVGEFEWIEGRTKDNVLVRVFVTPGKKHQAEFALQCAIKSLEFYNDYFGIPYPLPVMDLIAIPDFAHGAMENWGAVTYRETALLVDPEHSSSSNKQWVALVIAHELAHQWFGNLVTMEWWTHLWLNEGFATYMEYLAVDHIFPEWDIWTQFGYNDQGVALNLDGLKNTHPIEIEVGHPNEINEIFDEVSYSKGACVIRMLAGYLGQKDFREGLKHYLKKHSYANASTEDLWKALEKASGKPVGKIMSGWIKQPGYPLIKTIKSANKLELIQQRFFISELSRQKEWEQAVWQTPISLISDKNPKPKVSMMEGRETVLSVPKNADWIKLNAGETSFCRIAYPPEILEALHRPIREKKLSALDRLGVIRDTFALSQAGHLPTHETLALVEQYSVEDDFTVWTEVVSVLNGVANLIRGEKYSDKFFVFCERLLSPTAERIGWDRKPGETHTQGLLRSLLLLHAGHYGNRDTINKAKTMFAKGQVPADLRGVVYGLVAENGEAKEYRTFMKRFDKEQMQEEKNRLARALGQFRNTELLTETLEFMLSDKVRPQDKPFLLHSVWSNSNGKELAWDFVRKNWKALLKIFHGSFNLLGKAIKPASQFASGERAEEFEKFFRTHPKPGLDRTVEQVAERIRANALWLLRDRGHIGKWLDKRIP